MFAMRRSCFVARHELLVRELPDCLQHVEARLVVLAVGSVDCHQALVHQRGESVECFQLERSDGLAHRLGCLQSAAAGEHRQPPKHGLFGGVQEIVAPGNGAPHGLQPCW